MPVVEVHAKGVIEIDGRLPTVEHMYGPADGVLQLETLWGWSSDCREIALESITGLYVVEFDPQHRFDAFVGTPIGEAVMAMALALCRSELGGGKVIVVPDGRTATGVIVAPSPVGDEAHVLQRLREALRRPVHLFGFDIAVEVAVGVAWRREEDQLVDLVRRAHGDLSASCVLPLLPRR